MLVFPKLIAIATSVQGVITLAFIVGAVLSFTRWRRAGRAVLLATTVTLLFVAFVPFGRWLTLPLEDRFPRPALPAKVDGIVVLGGVTNPGITEARDQVTLDSAIGRVIGMMTLARRYPEARLVFSGGRSALDPTALSEADVVRRLLDEIGFDTSRVLFESRARTTRENAVLSRELVQPKSRETWLVVTSARHMPRAVGTFRAAGWPVIAYPVDYTTGGEAAPYVVGGLLENLLLLEFALYEWRGLVYYRLRGWIPRLFPGPEAASRPQEKASNSS